MKIDVLAYISSFICLVAALIGIKILPQDPGTEEMIVSGVLILLTCFSIYMHFNALRTARKAGQPTPIGIVISSFVPALILILVILSLISLGPNEPKTASAHQKNVSALPSELEI